jgi:L-2-hydroxyglutarate oxidase
VTETVEVIIVGGGIVGLAVARATLERFPGSRLIVLEKEHAIARHQTGHSSGVVHTGVYYRPGSLKARLCVRGREELLEYARERAIPHRMIGKLIVATDARELPELDELERRGRANGVERLRRVSPAEIREIEPEVRGIAALHLPTSAIVDYPAVAAELARDVVDAGGAVIPDAAVSSITNHESAIEVACAGSGQVYSARQLVNCAGLYADTVARLAGTPSTDRIIPFRGEFHLLAPARAGLVRGLVYPVPDPRLPFVDVHLTPTVDGRLLAGPNAILAFAREGYRLTDVRWAELGSTLTYSGFWRMLSHVPDAVVGELYRSLSREAIARDLRRMVPSLRAEDLLPAEAGVRAQAVGPDGTLREDFVFVTGPKALHVINAPSPAATCSLAIGTEVASRLPDPRSQ